MTPTQILRLAMPSWRRFLPGLLWGTISALAGVCLLAVSAWLIVKASLVDTLVPLSVAVVGVRFFAVTRAVTRYLERLASHDAALRQLADVRAEMLAQLIPLAPAGLGGKRRGEVLSAVIDDVENLQNLPLRVVQPLAVAAFTSVAAVIGVSFVSWQAGLTLLAALVLTGLVAVWAAWVFGSRAERAISPARAELAAQVIDSLGSLEVLRAFGVQSDARARIAAADAQLRRVTSRAALTGALAAAVVSLGAGFASVAALLAAVPSLALTDPPALAVVVLVPMVVFEVFGAAVPAASAWRSVKTSAEQLSAVVSPALPAAVAPELSNERAAKTVAATNANHVLSLGAAPRATSREAPPLTLRGITARWPNGTPALNGVDLSLAPGERLLVQGPSGAGKSSLANVLVGFLLPTAGSYTVGDTPAQELGDDLRKIIGLCEQDPWLFDLDIRQNLLFANDHASDDDLWHALDRVGLKAWAQQRGGLDARVGERGALVSGGQAQRLALARAILRDFPILVLDEPTAGVDAATSDALLKDLLEASDGRSVLLISHVEPPAGTVDRRVKLREGAMRFHG